jgi:hypothetical protein
MWRSCLQLFKFVITDQAGFQSSLSFRLRRDELDLIFAKIRQHQHPFHGPILQDEFFRTYLGFMSHFVLDFQRTCGLNDVLASSIH